MVNNKSIIKFHGAKIRVIFLITKQYKGLFLLSYILLTDKWIKYNK